MGITARPASTAATGTSVPSATAVTAAFATFSAPPALATMAAVSASLLTALPAGTRPVFGLAARLRRTLMPAPAAVAASPMPTVSAFAGMFGATFAPGGPGVRFGV